MHKQFYIYAQCRPPTKKFPYGEPFYIGKGFSSSNGRGRAYTFNKTPSNIHYVRCVSKYSSACIIYTYNCCSDQQALQYEVWMIAYGRAQGWRLTNATNGGEGSSGRTLSKKSLLKMRRARLGKRASESTRIKMSAKLYGNTRLQGHVHSTVSRKRIGNGCKKAWAIPEIRTRIMAARNTPECIEKTRRSKLGNVNALGKKWSVERCNRHSVRMRVHRIKAENHAK